MLDLPAPSPVPVHSSPTKNPQSLHIRDADAPPAMRAYVEAYGCTLNFGEARELEDVLTSAGWTLVEDPDQCDLAVLVTCIVIDKTERAMLKRIKRLSSAPQLIVTGCMATAGRERAQAAAPKAAFVAPGDYDTLTRLTGQRKLPSAAAGSDKRSYSIVPISTGCRGSCSYCITRLARGGLKSRTPERIVHAVWKAAASGPREIQLTAQDTAAYGSDIGTDLASLVRSACASPLDFRLRVGMMNPSSAIGLREDLGKMYREPKVFKFLHLPVQSASDAILADMQRGYCVQDFVRLVSGIREAVPLITLSTDLIVGYPGETADDHRMNMELIAGVQPDIVNVTRFSPRPGTPAADAGCPVVGRVAKDRSRELASQRFAVAAGKNRRWVGKIVNALATEEGKKGSTILRTDEYKQVVVAEELPLHKFYAIEILEGTSTHLIGRRVGSA